MNGPLIGPTVPGPAARAGRRARVALGVVLGLVALGACGGSGTPPPPAGQARPSSTATLRIVDPTPGEVVDGRNVRVRLELTGARITREVSTDLRPDRGHVHLRLDGKTLTLLGGLDESLNDLVGGPLEPGPHLLEAEFVASDHGPFSPRVISTVSFTVG